MQDAKIGENNPFPAAIGNGSTQCCGSGFGIRSLLDPWILESKAFPEPGSKTHILEGLLTIFG